MVRGDLGCFHGPINPHLLPVSEKFYFNISTEEWGGSVIECLTPDRWFKEFKRSKQRAMPKHTSRDSYVWPNTCILGNGQN